jgi:hypothetical protein
MSSSSANSHPTKFLSIDTTQISISEFKKNETNDGKRAYVNYTKTRGATTVQFPTFTTTVGVKRFEAKMEKDGMGKPSISLLVPLNSDDPVMVATRAKADAIYARFLEIAKEKPATFLLDPEDTQVVNNFNMKLKSFCSYQKDKKTGKLMRDRDPSMSIKFKFNEKTDTWYNENAFNKMKQHEYSPSVKFQELIFNEALGKKVLRDRPDITPLTIADEIPRGSKLTMLVQMNSIHEVNGNFSVPICAKKVVFEKPLATASEVDLGDEDVVRESVVAPSSHQSAGGLAAGGLSADVLAAVGLASSGASSSSGNLAPPDLHRETNSPPADDGDYGDGDDGADFE